MHVHATGTHVEVGGQLHGAGSPSTATRVPVMELGSSGLHGTANASLTEQSSVPTHTYACTHASTEIQRYRYIDIYI